MSLQLMQMLSTTIEAKDEYTKGHSHRVAEYSVLIARELGWNEKELSNLKNAAHLHDIGKIAIPDTILNKPSKLSEEEFSIIKEHTIIGANILKNISLIDHVQEIVRNHHERYDGNGYPDGLKGKEIPLHARIVAVADSYDAMSSQRIYRNQLPPEKIIQELENNKGTQFDPEITDIFLKLLREDRIHVKEDHLSITENTQIPEAEIEMSQFISDIMSTIRTQKAKENLDFLTGLPNRNKGEQAIAQLMKHHSGCLVFMDMDNLKTINDIYGHKAGDRVLKLLGNLLLEYKKIKNVTIEDIIDFHYKFELIHPFGDGNGRVGRMIMFRECLRNNIMPFIVLDNDKSFYMRGLKNYKNDKLFLIDTIKHEQDLYEKMCEELLDYEI